MRKKLSYIMMFIPILMMFLTPIYFAASTFAANTIKPADSVQDYGNRNDTSFLGLRPWDYGVGEITDESTLKSNLWNIVLNVVIDIGIIATYLALGYTIYGGYLYIFSGGDPGKVANGKKTLTQAFIGLAITMSATTIMSGFRVALVGGNGDISNCVSGGCINDTGTMVTNLINWFCGVAGVAAAVFLVYGGISYSTSAGDPGKVKKAKDIILSSLIGLIIVALAIAITGFVSNLIRNANDNAFVNTTIIS